MSEIEVCSHGRKLNNEYPCQVCLEAGDRTVANMSVVEHLKEAALSFFYFKFVHFLVDILWALQKATRTGEFGPTGYFSKYMKEYQNDKPNNTRKTGGTGPS